jgi:hypothetical protein
LWHFYKRTFFWSGRGLKNGNKNYSTWVGLAQTILFPQCRKLQIFFLKFWRLNLWEDFIKNTLEYMWNIVILKRNNQPQSLFQKYNVTNWPFWC